MVNGTPSTLSEKHTKAAQAVNVPTMGTIARAVLEMGQDTTCRREHCTWTRREQRSKPEEAPWHVSSRRCERRCATSRRYRCNSTLLHEEGSIFQQQHSTRPGSIWRNSSSPGMLMASRVHNVDSLAVFHKFVRVQQSGTGIQLTTEGRPLRGPSSWGRLEYGECALWKELWDPDPLLALARPASDAGPASSDRLADVAPLAPGSAHNGSVQPRTATLGTMAAARHQGSNIATDLAFNARWQQPLPASVTFDLTAASSHTLEKTDEGTVLLRNNTALLCDKLETTMGLPCLRLHYPLYSVLKARGWSIGQMVQGVKAAEEVETTSKHFHPHFAAQLARIDEATVGVGFAQVVTGPVFETGTMPQVDLPQ
eukprot:1370623-Rhodomonas_salina.1